MEQSPLQPTPVGAIRFNTDSSKLEYYDGNQWDAISSDSPEAQTGGTRGIWFGGWDPGPSPGHDNTISYINVDTTGDATDFGDLIDVNREMATGASRVRGVAGGGAAGPGPQQDTNRIEFVTIASTGNSTDFGDMNYIARGVAGSSNDTRMLIGGGKPESQSPNPYMNTIDYITIASTGNANDFGDLSELTRNLDATSNVTRLVWMGGENPSGDLNIISYSTIQTLGNTADFGDLVDEGDQGGASGNAVRGLWGGGYMPGPAVLNVIQYITFSTLGNALDFGDLKVARRLLGACSSPTRVVFGGGRGQHPSPGTYHDDMDYVQIMSTGNALDFGNLVSTLNTPKGTSNGHGGLG